MRILVYLSHPTQFYFYKNAIGKLREKGHVVFIVIKSKDILADLLDDQGWVYYNILPRERSQHKFNIIKSLLMRDIKLFAFVRKHQIQLLMGTDASLAHVGKILGRPCITTLEDDYEVIKHLADLTYPFTSYILAPAVCSVGKWENKKIGYRGYMKLAYLHSNLFSPDRNRLTVHSAKPFFLIRLSSLSAHHDFGIKGIRLDLLDKIIEKILPKGDLYITAEKSLPEKYAKFQLKIPLLDIHHYLYFAEMLICDGQSMAVEAAMLGTPSIRISSFAGRISVLEELEHVYQLTFGFKPENEAAIFAELDELLKTEKMKEVFQLRRQKMLSEKIDVTAFMVWFVENLPESAKVMKKNPEYQLRFK